MSFVPLDPNEWAFEIESSGRGAVTPTAPMPFAPPPAAQTGRSTRPKKRTKGNVTKLPDSG